MRTHTRHPYLRWLALYFLCFAVGGLSVPDAFALQTGAPPVAGVYLGSGTLVQPCQFPEGPYTYVETITAMRAAVTQAGRTLTIDATYVSQREDGSQYSNYVYVDVALDADGSIQGVDDYMYDTTTQVHLVTTGTVANDTLAVTFASHIVYLPDNGECDQTIAVTLHYDRQGTTAQLTWSPPDGNPLAPPRNLTTRIIGAGQSADPGSGSKPTGARDTQDTVTGYKVYRSNQPNVAPSPENFYASVPPSQTSTTAPVGSSGSFFVVTACYSDGESAPSNEAGAGLPGATLSKVAVKATKIVAKGEGFTDVVDVFVDGVRFQSAATVKNGKKVTQKGRLATGETIAQYFIPGRMVEISFVNSDGSISRFLSSR